MFEKEKVHDTVIPPQHSPHSAYAFVQHKECPKTNQMTVECSRTEFSDDLLVLLALFEQLHLGVLQLAFKFRLA